jgi:hypothetical protein
MRFNPGNPFARAVATAKDVSGRIAPIHLRQSGLQLTVAMRDIPDASRTAAKSQVKTTISFG